MIVNFLSLEYFLVAAAELNFTRAAKILYISQQSLSKHIAHLEKCFGAQLFDRNPPLTLTCAGQSLVKHAHILLENKKETEMEITDIIDFRSGSLSIGVTNARGTVILPMVLPPFHQAFPQIKLRLVEGTSQQLDESLLTGNVDLTIGFKPHNAINVESEELLSETSVLVVPHQILDTYLPGVGQEVRNMKTSPAIELFRACPFVTINPSTWAGAMFERYCRKMTFTPKVLVETQNIATLVSLCLAGMGVIMCPKIFLHKLNSLLDGEKLQNVSIFSLDHEPEHHVIAINYLNNKYQSQAAREFIRITKAVMSL